MSLRIWSAVIPKCASTVPTLLKQRYRWSYGTMQAVWKHKAAVLRARECGPERRIGWIGLPYLVFFQIALPLLAPLIDVFAIYGIVFLDPVPVIGYWLGFNLLNLVLGLYAFRLDRESSRPLWAMPLQQEFPAEFTAVRAALTDPLEAVLAAGCADGSFPRAEPARDARFVRALTWEMVEEHLSGAGIDAVTAREEVLRFCLPALGATR